MCLGTFKRLARSLATCFCFARVRIPAMRFLFHRTQFPMKQKKESWEKLPFLPALFQIIFIDFPWN